MDVILNPSRVPIKPSDINTSRHFWNAFGNREREISARGIVLFCQDRGRWTAFTADELTAFYKKLTGRNESFQLNGLDTEGFVQLGDNNSYRVTVQFVAACWGASPKVA